MSISDGSVICTAGVLERARQQGGEELGAVLLKNALSGSKIAIHSRSTNTIGVLDTDDFYQYLGGCHGHPGGGGRLGGVCYQYDQPQKAHQETLEKNMAGR
jgi:cobaltochelatase CobN